MAGLQFRMSIPLVKSSKVLINLKVGFDLVNIQLPLKMVEHSVAHSVAKRIEWVHGNLCVFSFGF